MFQVGVSFNILRDDEHILVGYNKYSGHIICLVKMDFTRKSRWVKDGHRTPDLEDSKYAGVVSQETVRIALTYVALHGTEVLASETRNAYVQAPTLEKHYIICGEEFGLENVGNRALIVRALYGGKAARRDFWHHFRNCIKFLGFKSKGGDPDVWMRPNKKQDGTEVYEYVLLYIDDYLVVYENAESILKNEIGRYFELKPDSIGPPSLYLGGHLRKVVMNTCIEAWDFGSIQYVQASVKNFEEYLSKNGQLLKVKDLNPLTKGYCPEIDISKELGSKEDSYYQSLIGIV